MATSDNDSPKNPRRDNGGAERRQPDQRPHNPRTPNIGNQVRDAVQGAIDSQQFQDLSSTVAASLDLAAQGISQGLSQAGEAMKQASASPAAQNLAQNVGQAASSAVKSATEAVASYASEAQRRQELARVEKRFGSPAALSGTGTVMAVTGAILTFDMALATAAFVSIGMVVPLVFSVGLLFFCITLLRNGIKRRKTAQQFKRYKRTIGSDEMVPIASLASATGTSEGEALSNVRSMLDRGLFREGRLDDAQATLILTDAAYQRYREARARKQNARRANMAAANGWTVREVAAEDVRVETVERAAKAQPKPEPERQLSPEARALQEKGDAYLAQLREADEDIEDEAVSAKIVAIETVVGKIIDHATENPQVIGDLQQLMNYYLPMTVKLLDAYADLEAQPVQGENITNSKREIEKTLDTLNHAFENLLDDLFRDMSWDVSSDIAVLHTVLAQEGLLDDPFAAPSPDGADAPDTLK